MLILIEPGKKETEWDMVGERVHKLSPTVSFVAMWLSKAASQLRKYLIEIKS